MAGVNSHDINTNKSVIGADQPTNPSKMPANGPTFHLFRQLPYELRLEIWETAVFDLPSRVCSFNEVIQLHFRSGVLDWSHPSSLVVFDSPSLRYVCQESRQVALKHSATAGWTISGTTHPFRYYDARGGILYIDNFRRLPSLEKSFRTQNHGETDEFNASAAMRVRQARHVVIPWKSFQLENYLSWQDIERDEGFTYSFVSELIRLFPRLEEITVAISQTDVADTVASRQCRSTWEPPQRPCKLGAFARFEPTSEEQPEITVVDNAYREEPLRSLYRQVGRISGSFERAANIIAATIGTQRLPAPMIAHVYQLSQGADAGYKWQEIPGTR
ncbi:hypothetical protein INS49_010757 [Diaporthe citri]|uniref:uncharacterized protein n=1 Tax=Diaporthe citri TaxID=83186 RepID=UPI001C7F4E05|nr:uncharacterized protein INS49_010757 [Diaporthe citri]KAG6359705.1 hypothetical protein INS49_010757 [Diaporthe citri]